MLTCLPQSICNWDYRIPDASTGPAELSFHYGEHGSLTLGGVPFSINKQGWLSGRWLLEGNGVQCAEATKPSAFSRSFDVRFGESRYVVEAQSAFTRSFEIRSAGEVVGLIEPRHAFTRRATITCQSEVPELVQIFSFWLAALLWRRAAKKNH